DSVFVKNLSSETELRLAGSDILHLLPASSLRRVSEEFAMAGVYPNPTEFECDIDFIITKPAFTIIEITDVGGKILVQHKEFLNDAYYRFTLSGIGSGVYVLNIRSDSFIYQTKIVGTGRSNQPCLRKTIVAENTQQQTTGATAHYSGKSTIDMLYAFGDILFFEAISDDGHRTIATLKLTADDETVTDHTVYFGFYSCVDAELYMYSIVKIGGHFWMAEDLNTPWFSDTSTIENIPDSTAWAASSQAACCNYGNNASLQTLYNWYAATDGRKICPDGWHLPADFEWQRLEAYIGMSVDEQGANGWRGDGTAALLKESGTQNWLSQSGTDINLSGFSARPAGMRNFAGLYLYSEKNAVWWTATENRDNTAWCRALQFDSNAVYRKDGLKNMGLAVRCIKNYPPEVITGPVNETTDTSVVVSVKLLNNGGAEVTEKGVVWSQNPVPLAEANEGAVLYDGDDEIFELLLPGLTAGSEYYYRAYAVNEVGVGYGSIETFSTSGALVTPPVVVTIEVIDITHNSAGSGGNVISDGGAPVTARGVVWAPFSNPSLEFNQGYTTDGSGTGEFFSTITGLGQSTSFYVCAYATNSAGTTYGNVIEFTTLSAGFVCGETYVDSRDGNEYSTVQIGNQCWLAENLKYLPSVVAPTSSSS
ncbi:MAG TPA: FISUMP domain-containing protein, partial [Bacteroidales bacterium]|nr:FISUMP domain-containing protein [Bacteroidales bacterium]